jgi:hypothetical protein
VGSDINVRSRNERTLERQRGGVVKRAVAGQLVREVLVQRLVDLGELGFTQSACRGA